MNYRNSAFGLFLALAAPGTAQTAQTANGVNVVGGDSTKQREPLTLSGLKLDLGYYSRYTGRKSEFYYKLDYQSKSLLSKGSAPDSSDVLAVPSVGEEPLMFKAERGATTVGGTVFQSLGLEPLKRVIPGLRDYNLVAGVNAQLETSKQTTYQFGIERRPIAPLRKLNLFRNALLEEFLAVGLAGERNSDEKDNVKESFGATYRARIGKGFQYVLSEASVKEYEGYLKKYADLGEKAALEQIKKLEGKGTFPETDQATLLAAYKRFVEQGGLTKTGEERAEFWKQKLVDRFGTDLVEIPRDQPAWALWLESSGTLGLSEETVGRRIRAIYAANARFYIVPRRPNAGFIDVRYENGYTLAEPDKRANLFHVSLGLRF